MHLISVGNEFHFNQVYIVKSVDIFWHRIKKGPLLNCINYRPKLIYINRVLIYLVHLK